MPKYAGVDMSYCQTGVNYKALKNAKIGGKVVKFAMLRFSYGMGMDTMFETHYKGCKDAGIHVGVYHFFKAQSIEQAKEEARWLVKNLRRYEIAYPVALDFEDEKLFALKLTKEQHAGLIDAFMKILIDANYYVVLYTNPNCLEYKLPVSMRTKYDLWLAQWRVKTASEYGQTMWQYAAYGTEEQVEDGWATNVGTVEGVKCAIDVNWCYVGYAAKIKKLGKNKPIEYTITATKTVDKDDLDSTVKQLKTLGYKVTTKQK